MGKPNFCMARRARMSLALKELKWVALKEHSSNTSKHAAQAERNH